MERVTKKVKMKLTFEALKEGVEVLSKMSPDHEIKTLGPIKYDGEVWNIAILIRERKEEEKEKKKE